MSGLVVTPYGHGLPCRTIEVIEAGHPTPDRAGAEAAQRILELAHGAAENDLVIALFSGGGSALLTLPAPGLSLADLQEVNRQALHSGMPIAAINSLRKHLSAISGGRLAAAAFPAAMVTFLISDVPGDDPAVIASGPTVADPSTFAAARAAVEQYGLRLPPAASRHLAMAADETPKPSDPRLAHGRFVMLATPAMALAAAAGVPGTGVEVVSLGAELQGEARLVARDHAGLVRRLQERRTPGDRPIVVLSGGETTVTVKGSGRGGRNTEYLLALAVELGRTAPGLSDIFALAADTDGIDGAQPSAGAFILPDTLERATAAGLDPEAHLADNDSHRFFDSLGDLLVTGPTRTNVNDFRGILIS